MLKRESREITLAMVQIEEATELLSEAQAHNPAPDLLAALRTSLAALKAAQARIQTQVHNADVEIADAAELLDVSDKTVRKWIERGALQAGRERGQVDRSSLAKVHQILSELRARGENRNWLASLVDYSQDMADRRSDSVREGLAELRQGRLEPA